MTFTEIPFEVYGIILNYMKNPLKLSLVNKELNKLLRSEYGRCYYKKFRFKYYRKSMYGGGKLKVKEYVTILYVFGADITDDQLKQFPNLQILYCICCPYITDKSIIELKQLQKLDCVGCPKITDKSIIELKQLQTLDCRDCQNITDKSIIELKQLQTLYCGRSPNITDKSIIELKQLQTLYCRWCQNITNFSKNVLKKNNPNIKIRPRWGFL